MLIVDDEESMLRLIEAVLNAHGIATLTASGSERALEIVANAKTPPAVAICDVLMPKIDGMELARRLCAKAPSLCVVFISGHLSDVSWWPADLREHRFIPKPFDSAQLLEAVRSAMGV